ncbi:collagen alpha-1(VII) chain-like [Bacillus rossius redtenbacheri]|uniref:collagen alpha-1(VII) chain-like n=1 Tax=Bacillus rossius redtenbacheri TaxID=93214 RepID=UPI002FDEDC4F
MWILWLALLLPEIVNGQNSSCVAGSVGAVRVTAVTAFTASVEWGEAAAADPSCDVRYSVCWTLTLSDNTRCASEPLNTTAYTIEELNPCVNYTVEVTATEAGGGEERGNTTLRTLPRSPLFANATETGPGEARVFWLHLFLGNDCVTQFSVTWAGGVGLAPASSNQLTARGLASCADYNFSVAALDAGLLASEPLSAALTTDMLSPVLSVSAADVDAHSFDVLWTRPLDSAGSACSHWFQPCWGAPGAAEGQECVTLARDATSTRVSGRAACSPHNVSVATVSERSSHTPFWLLHVTPSENRTVIAALHVTERTVQSAHARWTPLYEGLPCAMAYRLCWSRQPEGDDPSCVILHTDVTAHNVTGLRPRALYSLQLAALFDTDDVSEAVNVTVFTSDGSGATTQKISGVTLAVSLMILLRVPYFL